MSTIKATVAGGRLELDVPADWPDGTQVEIHSITKDTADDVMSPDEIARILAAMDQFEPLDISEAEQAAWDAERYARKEWEKSRFPEQAEKLKRMWE